MAAAAAVEALGRDTFDCFRRDAVADAAVVDAAVAADAVGAVAVDHSRCFCSRNCCEIEI